MVEEISLNYEISIVQDFINKSNNEPIDDINKIIDILINYQNDSMNIDKSNPYYDVIKEMILLEPREKFQVLLKVFSNNVNKKEYPTLIPKNLIELIAEQLDIVSKEKPLDIMLTYNDAELLGQIHYDMNIDHIDIFSDKIIYKNIYEKLYKIGKIGNVNFIEENILNTEQQQKYDLILSPILFKSKKIDFNNKKVDIKEAVLEKTLNRLKDNGYLFSIVKDGVLNNKQFEDLRTKILNKFNLLSIIELPKTILYENRAVNTSLLIINNSEAKIEEIFLAQLEKDTLAEKKDLMEKFNSYFSEVVK